jgi:hypothetical protein
MFYEILRSFYNEYEKFILSNSWINITNRETILYIKSNTQ